MNTTLTNFIGKSTPLTQDGFNTAIETVGTKAAELWAVISVETSSCGYFDDRRPQILYERHIFYKITKAGFPVSDINSPEQGGYAGGAAEYDRLVRAISLDRDAALQSASWGIGQVLGQNFAAAGYPDAPTMVNNMCETEDGQLLAVCNFLKANGLDRNLRNHDWVGFARGYNGPNYTKFSYDTKLLQHYQKYAVGSLPDLTIRAAQLMLNFLKYNTGGVDGANGPRTESAVKAFQASKGLPVTGVIDEGTIAALEAATAVSSSNQ